MKLKFGTGGLRAVMGPLDSQMNLRTIGEATVGMADYAKIYGKVPKVAIAYDSRRNSEKFAREAARILALKGCEPWIYPQLMPTPTLSFAVRELPCDWGICITASHNPKEYQGYKVYGSDGGQITEKTACEISKFMEKAEIDSIPEDSYEELLEQGKIQIIPERILEKFYDSILACGYEEIRNSSLKIVYTPLHGTGEKCVFNVLKKKGFSQIFLVPEQRKPNGDFPTCPYPNPEDKEAMKLGMELCEKLQADLLLASDPDCDRVGVAAKKGDAYEILTGNQVGILLLDYILQKKTQKGQMPMQPVMIKTIVTSAMAEKIAESYGVEVLQTLTGFKYIGEQIAILERAGKKERYVFGMEESCGYLIGTYVRDKDAVGASMLICEMADHYKKQEMTLWDRLEQLYEIYGRYETILETYAFTPEENEQFMERLRTSLKAGKTVKIEGAFVSKYEDYLEGVRALPKSNVMKLWMSNGKTLIIRPSGTEPKMKVYWEKVSF